jgi:hypothetical protein
MHPDGTVIAEANDSGQFAGSPVVAKKSKEQPLD